MDAAGEVNVRKALLSHARVLNELCQDITQIRMDMMQMQQEQHRMKETLEQLRQATATSPPALLPTQGAI
ncbi:Uncharacterized protein DAT39_020751 [Clarias magur]|uniref:Uncharacterized protein n=1 Tax=Clarias magur TaxID=1594786 RepID=A0A8J4WSV9_CLAMG|nr:Uncharacterized protein DAT39_020751 [Clarias magur]